LTLVEAPVARRRRMLTLLPLVVVFSLAGLLLARLFAGDPARIPSALIDKPAPSLNLPGLEGGSGLADADLRSGHVTVVNVFGSWCEPCRGEHPFLNELAGDPDFKAAGVALVGVAQRDQPDAIRKFLAELGNPYAKIGLDPDDRAGIDWGVYGVPETFVVRGDGVIAYKHIGPIDADALKREVKPAILAAAGAPKLN